jgi:electron transfer flavoprotein alpha subunit
MTVLCLVERDGAGVADASLRALTFARGLAGPGDADPGGADQGSADLDGADLDGTGPGGADLGGVSQAGGRLAAVLFADAEALASEAPAGQELAGYGVSDAYVIEPGQLPGYAPLAWARVLAGLIEATGATAVLVAGTDRGAEVMAHLGALAGAPMAANCVSAAPSGEGGWRITRQRWAGLLLEDAVLEAPTALLTVATDAIAPTPATGRAALTVHRHEPALADGDLAVLATESAERSGGISLATARVVVGGGRGVGGPDGFAPLEELAGLLGGVVGVSRVVTSEGWRPHKQQVGQTGTKITPELYLACGISGAIQHIAGCASAKHIVAVNSDAGAPILSHAEYAVIGDLHEVIPALVAAIKARGASA